MDGNAPSHVEEGSAPPPNLSAGTSRGGATTDGSSPFVHASGSQAGAENAGAEPISEGSGRTSSSEFELDDMVSEGSRDDDEETGLTGLNRRKRIGRNRQSIALNESIGGDSKTSQEEQIVARQEVFQKALIITVLIGLWYEYIPPHLCHY
jgi:hypothetical protein